MNILFYTVFKVSCYKGGTEHATVSVATGLKMNYGCKCFSVYGIDDDTPKESCFEDEIKWNWWEFDSYIIESFIKQNQIDWIIIQGAFEAVNIFKKLVQEKQCHIAFVHHFAPGWEINFNRYNDYIFQLKKSKTCVQVVKRSIKLCLSPFYRWRYLKNLPVNYRNAYEQADYVVLLCMEYISQYINYAHLESNNKFVVIPNSLSYNELYPAESIRSKKPIVLIVSRLEDTSKRLSLALQIWKEVKKSPISRNWQMKIVGDGNDEKKYQNMIVNKNIPDVSLLGRQQPNAYYQEASVFLMTSKSECFPLTLLEAQQFGVVPIAFNTFASLKDIVCDEMNGFIIPECDVQLYVGKLLELMANTKRREQMAENALVTSIKFSQIEIAKLWWKLLNKEA